jgi:two-component system OmpR family response regulator
MRILIVDDEIVIADLLADAVREDGHEATVAYGGAEALALLNQGPPDAVFLDLLMPEIHGIELLRRIREIYPVLPVIVVTGRVCDDELDAARRLGVTDIIEKPLLLNQLTDALAHMTEGPDRAQSRAAGPPRIPGSNPEKLTKKSHEAARTRSSEGSPWPYTMGNR